MLPFSPNSVMRRCFIGLGLLSFSIAGEIKVPTVTVSGLGRLAGVQTTVPDGTALVNKYVGVPFAAVPTGSLRFQPPHDAPTWTGVYEAIETKPACHQQFSSNPVTREESQGLFSDPLPKFSEDCLYLNIYTPVTASTSPKLPVMLWLYGGSLKYGNAGQPLYDGSSLAGNQEIILVTTNYRTNVFGFSNSRDIAFSQRNSGYLDQRKALDWLYRYVEAFGGDPEQITVFGQSAGGYSVKQLLNFPPARPRIHAAIMESEGEKSPNSDNIEGGNPVGAQNWYDMTKNFHCNCPGVNANEDCKTPEDAANELQCMQQVDDGALEHYVTSKSIVFSPVEDATTQSYDSSGFLRNHTFGCNNYDITAKNCASSYIPFMIGSNGQDGSAFADIKYPSVNGSKKAAIAERITLGSFQCPAALIADTAVQNGYTNVWRYYFNASFANQSPVFPDLGAFHSAEVYQIFGTYNRTGSTPFQAELSKFVQRAWATFAKHPLAGPGWRQSSSESNLLANLGSSQTLLTEIPARVIDSPCATYTTN